MSLDLWMESARCEACGRDDDPPVDWNYTYNVSPMWSEATGRDGRMVEIEGLTGTQARPVLCNAIAAMEADMPRFRAMNPSNGWGDADSFLDALRRLEAACIAYPAAVWRAWR